MDCRCRKKYLQHLAHIVKRTDSYNNFALTTPNGCTHATTSAAIFKANFPTLVPPNFCTSHLASGSMLFWWRFGGVLGGEVEREDDLEDGGVEGGDDIEDIISLPVEIRPGSK